MYACFYVQIAGDKSDVDDLRVLVFNMAQLTYLNWAICT